jgi:ABC-type nitrate/sulfonate/bicarbonate transport system permease component
MLNDPLYLPDSREVDSSVIRRYYTSITEFFDHLKGTLQRVSRGYNLTLLVAAALAMRRQPFA